MFSMFPTVKLSPLPRTALAHWWMDFISDENPSLHNQREGKQIIFCYTTFNMQAVGKEQEVHNALSQ